MRPVGGGGGGGTCEPPGRIGDGVVLVGRSKNFHEGCFVEVGWVASAAKVCALQQLLAAHVGSWVILGVAQGDQVYGDGHNTEYEYIV